jgi:hypothetical protein
VQSSDGHDAARQSLERARARWLDLAAWGVDGICTNYPAEVERTLASLPQAASA